MRELVEPRNLHQLAVPPDRQVAADVGQHREAGDLCQVATEPEHQGSADSRQTIESREALHRRRGTRSLRGGQEAAGDLDEAAEPLECRDLFDVDHDIAGDGDHVLEVGDVGVVAEHQVIVDGDAADVAVERVEDQVGLEDQSATAALGVGQHALGDELVDLLDEPADLVEGRVGLAGVELVLRVVELLVELLGVFLGEDTAVDQRGDIVAQGGDARALDAVSVCGSGSDGVATADGATSSVTTRSTAGPTVRRARCMKSPTLAEKLGEIPPRARVSESVAFRQPCADCPVPGATLGAVSQVIGTCLMWPPTTTSGDSTSVRSSASSTRPAPSSGRQRAAA